MTKKYNLIDGGQIEAATAKEFVEKLMAGSRFDSSNTIEEYMIGFAERYEIQSGDKVNHADPDSFLNDLVKFGYAHEI